MIYKIQQGKEIVNSNGILLAGKILESIKIKRIIEELGWKGRKSQRILDILKSWIGLFIQGLSDYEDIKLLVALHFGDLSIKISTIVQAVFASIRNA